MMSIRYQISPAVTNEALNSLFKASWPTHNDTDFRAVLAHSLVYICAYDGAQLVGFVNIAWDGGIHAFLLDTTVHPNYRRHGIGLQLVRTGVAQTQAKGIQWVHVDYEPSLKHFYQQCGFRHTAAGLIHFNE